MSRKQSTESSSSQDNEELPFGTQANYRRLVAIIKENSPLDNMYLFEIPCTQCDGGKKPLIDNPQWVDWLDNLRDAIATGRRMEDMLALHPEPPRYADCCPTCKGMKRIPTDFGQRVIAFVRRYCEVAAASSSG